MANYSFTIEVGSDMFKKLLKIATEDAFILMYDDFNELEMLLNMNNIANDNDLTDEE